VKLEFLGKQGSLPVGGIVGLSGGAVLVVVLVILVVVFARLAYYMVCEHDIFFIRNYFLILNIFLSPKATTNVHILTIVYQTEHFNLIIKTNFTFMYKFFIYMYRRRRKKMNNGKALHPFDAHLTGNQHNQTYETNGIPNDDKLTTDSGCLDVATDGNSGDEYNSIHLQTFNDYEHPQDDATYNHITIGSTTAIPTDNTYAHIPKTKAATFDNTYSHMSNMNSRPEQENVNETDDSTYNHLGEPTALAAVSCNGQLTDNPNNGLTDDTYSHINANNNGLQNQKLRTDYEDTTYNHLGDIPTSTSTPGGLLYGQQSKTGQSTHGVTDHTNENRTTVAGRYNCAVVNKHPQAVKPAFHVDDGAHDYLVLEPDKETKGKPKPYDYAVVNNMSLASGATVSPEDGPHEYFVLEPTQPKATKP